MWWGIALLVMSVVWPVWMVRRMRHVRALMAERDRAERAKKPYRPDFDDVVASADGLVMSRANRDTDALIDADKAATAMPDIVKSLEGRR